MDHERWREIEAVFHGASERSAAERGAYLNQRCATDPELRADVERLLAHDDETRSFVDIPAVGFESRPPDFADPWIGRTVGAYRVVARIAAGGMGIVYRGERNDGLYEYPVAIKFVRHDLNHDQILRRFDVERKTLANLSHPNIARLLDGGVSDDGIPYLVMEFVEGSAIDLHCDEQRLGVHDRLRLFCTVCRAVHHAHQNLVVHRDLKPANIVVGASGTPKLLDFGIAKLLEADGTAPERTATLARMLTPDYASPEQVRGETITTASDVYALGVVLYGLLTGRRPYRLTGARMDEVERLVCEREPTRPSAALADIVKPPIAWRGESLATRSVEHDASLRGSTPDRLRRTLQGDLDNIVLMALRKEPDRRYASAEQFAADIERFLEGMPVLARRATLRYRGLKFARRNRWALATAALIFVALSASAVVSARLARQADHEATHARIESDSAQEVARILAHVFVDPARTGRAVTGADTDAALDAEAERVRRQYADRPHLQANLLDAIGRIFLETRNADRAEHLIEEAMAIRVATFGSEHLEVARSLASRGMLHTARGEDAAAVEAYRDALDLHRRLPAGVHTDVAGAASRLTRALIEIGETDEARVLGEEALAIRRERLGDDDPLVADTLDDLARIDVARGDSAGARARLAEALAIRRRTLGDDHALVKATRRSLDLVDPAPR